MVLPKYCMPGRGGSASWLFSLSTTTDLQNFWSVSSCCSVESTKPWNRNGVSVQGRSSSAMYMPKRSSATGTVFLNDNSLRGLKIIGQSRHGVGDPGRSTEGDRGGGDRRAASRISPSGEA